MTFYYCKICGNIITYATDSGVKVVCCGEEMQELVADTVEASKEKHIPVIEREGSVVTVKIGSVPHPMIDAHYIGWVALETNMGCQFKELERNSTPEAKFALLEGDEVIAAFAWCNLHGLWKA